jgi:hypothetical protein
MLIPLGILAGSGGVEGDYELIATEILGSAQSSVVFDVSTLASTYKHLQIRAAVRSTATHSNRVNASLRFNSDSGTNYSAHTLIGTGSSVVSEARVSVNRAERALGDATVPTANAAANVFGAIVLDILDPFSTTKAKTTRTLSGQANSSDPRIGFCSGRWGSTAAVTAIELYTDDSGGFYNWAANSRFSIYGIKGE